MHLFEVGEAALCPPSFNTKRKYIVFRYISKDRYHYIYFERKLNFPNKVKSNIHAHAAILKELLR